MNGKAGGRRPSNKPSEAGRNGNNLSMVAETPSGPQSHTRQGTRTPRRAATFGKRSNSMRRNPNAEVTRQGWLHKQASSGVKQWNKRWFVLTDRCLFYYKDEKEEGILGSLPLLSFKIGPVQRSDNISRRFAFKVGLQRGPLICRVYLQHLKQIIKIFGTDRNIRQVWSDEEEDEREETEDFKGSIAFCLQVEHAGTRTYYFSADSHKEQEEWIQTMSEAARVQEQTTPRDESKPTATGQNNNDIVVATRLEPSSDMANNSQGPDPHEPVKHELKDHGLKTGDTTSTTPVTPKIEVKTEEKVAVTPHQPNGCHNNGPPNGSRYPSQENVRDTREPPEEIQRDFVPKTAPERLAQRKSSMSHLQQWFSLRRITVPPDNEHSPSRYYRVNRGMSLDSCGMYGGPPFVEEYPLYPASVRPKSICSMSAAYDWPSPRWTVEDRRRSGPQGPHPAYNPQLDSAQNSMRSLSIQPRSQSVPRLPSSSSGGRYSPHSFVSPARSPSARIDLVPGRFREEGIYADPSVYGLRRSLSSPFKCDLPGDRRSYSPGMYHYSYPASPSLHSKMEEILDLQLQRNLKYLDQQMTDGGHLIGMVTRRVERSSPRTKLFSQVPPFGDIYGDRRPTLKLNESETSKLLDRLCEQNRVVKEQEAVVHHLRMEKDSLEGVLVATHQEMELYRNQPLALEKLQHKKESLQNKLISMRGELSQANSVLITTLMEFDALEDEVNSIHCDLYEQLNAGGHSELVHTHIQKEFWRVQDVLEGLHKHNSSRGTDTAKHRVSGASGSYSSNSPASPLIVTSPLNHFSPASQISPTTHLTTEEVCPPRPPLPKSYQPMESSQSVYPSIPHRPLDSNAGLRRMSPHAGIHQENYKDHEELSSRKQSYSSQGGKTSDFNSEKYRQNKVGVSPSEEKNNSAGVQLRKVPNSHVSRERPKSAVFPAEVKFKMSVEEQNERIRRNQSSSVREKRRSLTLSSYDSFKASSFRVVRRRVTADEADIKGLEAAVRGQDVESPRQEIARLRRQLSTPEKVQIMEPRTALSPEQLQERQQKVQRIKTLITKSNMQNLVSDGPSNPEQQFQDQEKRMEISCTLAAEAERAVTPSV